ncbi:MAG: IS21 family transposase [Candidatus Omnitrophica bacterium]|nr:IS21 family transposase [Candidatus Omnitrophota bacterium]
MNVLKPNLKTTVETLLDKGISQREINRKTGINRKTIRRYGQLYHEALSDAPEHSNYPTGEGVATGFWVQPGQNTPPRPPALEENLPKHARSACEPHRQWIEEQLRLGRNAMAMYQDLVELFGFTHRYNSVKRFVRGLRRKDPHQYDRLEFLPGEESQVDYGTGAPTLHDSGKYRRPRLFVMVLKYSGRAFRKVVWKSSKETWCRLHEEAFRYFGGCPQYVTLDNLKEGVIKADIYDPELNVLYAKMLLHYGVVADPARVNDPNRKGTVENGVKYTQNTALKGRRFDNIEAQNDWLRHWEERWAALRIHGRAKRQVEEMFQEEKPYLAPLPLAPFVYFRQESRTVYDDGTIQVGNCYYAASPAPLYSKVVVRIYDEEIEILDPGRMEVIRRHPKSKRPGSLIMEPRDRIFNPSRQTDRLLARAEIIGPHTFSLCETWFNEEGRSGQRRMYGVINLVRHYPARYVEKAAELAKANGLKSSKALRRMVENMVVEDDEKKAEPSGLTQDHPLIRPGEDYAAFWQQHAAGESPLAGPLPENTISSGVQTILREQLPQVWQQASWLRVIEVFDLAVDHKRRRRDDEIWLKSPFTQEEKASMHVSLSENIFKDFSSGKGGGIMQFCREMLRRQGLEMTMFDVAQWMVSEGISTVNHPEPQSVFSRRQQAAKAGPGASKNTNPAIEIDLRRYLRPDHPELDRRGISAATCRYLGCGFLSQRSWVKTASPLNSRLVFQVRGVRENGRGLQPVILSHVGRALSREQEDSDGKYWSYPFKKGWEIYNQDHILLDEEAWRQANKFGLILTEGFFDVAKLVEAGCRNVVALMGSAISGEQIERLVWVQTLVRFPQILLFLDRDQAGVNGARQVREQLSHHGLSVTVFDWDQLVPLNGQGAQPIPESIQDPADMSVEQLRALRRQGIL